LTAGPGKSTVEDKEKTLPGFPLASISNQYAAMKHTDTLQSLHFVEKNSGMKARILKGISQTMCRLLRMEFNHSYTNQTDFLHTFHLVHACPATETMSLIN